MMRFMPVLVVLLALVLPSAPGGAATGPSAALSANQSSFSLNSGEALSLSGTIQAGSAAGVASDIYIQADVTGYGAYYLGANLAWSATPVPVLSGFRLADVDAPNFYQMPIAGLPSATYAFNVIVVRSGAAATSSADRLALGSAAVTINATATRPDYLTDLPTIRISTRNAAPIESRETYVDATFLLTNPLTSAQATPLTGSIRGRGSSTWGMPKKPYKIKFTSDAQYKKMSDMLGMKKHTQWNLLADYADRSLLRNKLALALGGSSVFSDGLKWTPSGRHVEVYLNDEYAGVYLFTEDIRIATERLNIKKMSKDFAVNDIDGGYIVEVDWTLDCYNDGFINLQHRTPRFTPFCIDKPDEADINVNQQQYIKSLLNAVEDDIVGRAGIERINPASFADWYLLSELFRNNDSAFWGSVFFWKDTEAAKDPRDRLLNMGPIWDFDISAGNFWGNDAWKPDGCWVSRNTVMTAGAWPNWMASLFNNSDFLSLTISRWKQKRAALEAFVNSGIDAYSRGLEAAQQRNFARWPILGQQLYSKYTFATYAEEVAFLKRYLNERMVWLDQAFESPASFNALCK